jgi:hypothetical protein
VEASAKNLDEHNALDRGRSITQSNLNFFIPRPNDWMKSLRWQNRLALAVRVDDLNRSFVAESSLRHHVRQAAAYDAAILLR